MPSHRTVFFDTSNSKLMVTLTLIQACSIQRSVDTLHYSNMKRISKFMTSDSKYQDDIKRGNPTKLKRVNALFRTVRAAEVAGKGAPLHARSPFTDAEYCRVMCIVEGLPDEGKLLFCSAILQYQLYIGARVDDTAKLSKANVKANLDASLDKLSLISKLCWSKHIQEENQVHEQILFGAGDVAQEKNSCSLVLKLKVFISKYLQEHYRLCITRAALFLKSVPGTFFNATTSSESNCDRDCRGHPSGLTVDYSTPLHFTRNLTLEIGL